jgi:hypothetical protein
MTREMNSHGEEKIAAWLERAPTTAVAATSTPT